MLTLTNFTHCESFWGPLEVSWCPLLCPRPPCYLVNNLKNHSSFFLPITSDADVRDVINGHDTKAKGHQTRSRMTSLQRDLRNRQKECQECKQTQQFIDKCATTT